MKQFTKTQLGLLHLLADGQCHSGNALGEQLGISRTAVWKQLSSLAELGLALTRIPKQGYRLNHPMIPLDEQQIRHLLATKQFCKPLKLHLFATIDSTNRFLKDLETDSLINICCAEKQTQGRGRFGRLWVSPFGENIYFSSRWELNCCLSRLSGLSLVVGLAILACLKERKIDEEIAIKWPNDILWADKKLCGILIEIIAETNSCAQVIIGIGMNVNTATQENPLPDKLWGSLYEMTGQYFDRNQLVASLIYHLESHLEKFLYSGFAAFSQDWQKADYLAGQFIKLSQPTGSIEGYACGVNEFGQLCLRDRDGQIHYLSAGDTSLGNLESTNN